LILNCWWQIVSEVGWLTAPWTSNLREWTIFVIVREHVRAVHALTKTFATAQPVPPCRPVASVTRIGLAVLDNGSGSQQRDRSVTFFVPVRRHHGSQPDQKFGFFAFWLLVFLEMVRLNKAQPRTLERAS
jgi:hypothetical protein